MVDGSTCRFCSEAIAADVTKCPHCGEPLRARAVLRWNPRDLTLVELGDMPIGVCFSCARSCPTLPLRRQEPGGARTVEIPTCAACARRATALPLVFVGAVSFAGFLFMCLVPMFGRASWNLFVTAALLFCALFVLTAGLIAYSLHSRRVRAIWGGQSITLVVPDVHALRRAVETDAL